MTFWLRCPRPFLANGTLFMPSFCRDRVQPVFIAKNEQLRFSDHRRQEVMLRFNLSSELVYRVHGRIDVSPESFLCTLYHCNHVAKGRFTHDHQVDVARSVKLTPCGGAEHECCIDAVGEWHQSFTPDVHESGGLRE